MIIIGRGMTLVNIQVEERMAFYNVKGVSVAIIQENQVNVRNYGELEVGSGLSVTDETIFSACSISKFMTAMLVMKLVSDDVLSLDEDINEYLISWQLRNQELFTENHVTIRHLLSHQAGIVDPQDSFMELEEDNEHPSNLAILKGDTPYCLSEIVVSEEPGAMFHYSDAGFCVLQQLIEDVTKKPFEQVMREEIWHPLQMQHSFYHTVLLQNKHHVASGHNKYGEIVKGKYPIYPYEAASGLWTTSSDLAKLCTELMDSLEGKGRLGIGADLINEMIRPQYGKEWIGLSLFLDETELGLEAVSYGWGVGFQCMLVMYPHLRKGAVMLTNSELGVHQLEGFIGELYRALFAVTLEGEEIR